MNRGASRWIRRRARRRRFEVLAGDTYATCAKVDRHHGQAETKRLSDSQKRALRAAVSSLSAPERMLLKRRAEGMTVRQIADAMGCSARSVEHRLSRVVSHLRQALESGPNVRCPGKAADTDAPSGIQDY
jgi:RNA polymerase sigma factor (sigma-70 family)